MIEANQIGELVSVDVPVAVDLNSYLSFAIIEARNINLLSTHRLLYWTILERNRTPLAQVVLRSSGHTK